MKIYDTMTRSLQELKPSHSGKISLFVCGATVYDDIHIGNARTFVFFDLIAKYLRSIGFLVHYVQNITDVDDKIIKKANEENLSSEEIASRYLEIFLQEMKSLRVDSVSIYAPTSKFIPEILSQIRRLFEKGYAYVADDGVYFRIRKFEDYGRLSGQKLENLVSGKRVEITAQKEDEKDFVLWKFKKPDEPFWESPWGDGRPGWHIEDTAITEYFFGPTYDIHGGGSDLIFPHHEAEIAQMRSISGRRILSRYWTHTGMLSMSSEKMAKSVGNIVRVDQVLKDFETEDLRFFFLNSNYRSIQEFNYDLLKESSSTRSKLQNLYEKLETAGTKGGKYILRIQEIQTKVDNHLQNDFDTRSAIRELLDFATEVFRNITELTAENAKVVRTFLDRMDSIFGFITHKVAGDRREKLASALIEFRNKLRKEKKFADSDQIRSILEETGFKVEDTGNDTEWR